MTVEDANTELVAVERVLANVVCAAVAVSGNCTVKPTATLPAVMELTVTRYGSTPAAPATVVMNSEGGLEGRGFESTDVQGGEAELRHHVQAASRHGGCPRRSRRERRRRG